MKPPKIVNIGKEEYTSQYWPSIQNAIKQVIMQPNSITFSQEELYRSVYHVCCQRHTVTLYNDLMNLMESYMTEMYNFLLQTSDENFIMTIAKYFVDFRRVSDVISVAFRYMDRVYITDKLQTNIKTILLNSLSKIVVSKDETKIRLDKLLKTLPPRSDPAMLMALIKLLYELDKNFVSFNPQLFAMYIPCLQPSRGIQYDLIETQELITSLRMQGFGSQNGVLKRKLYVAETT